MPEGMTVPDFMLFYRHGRRRHLFEQVIRARTRQVALKNFRRYVVAMLRRRGIRIKVVAFSDIFTLETLPLPPSVGVFWRVRQAGMPTLLADYVPEDDAEEYGDCLTHGAHADYWDRLAALSAPTLRGRGLPGIVRSSEYDDWPRGRVVLHRPTGRFIIYADRNLQTPKIIEEIAQRFALPRDRIEVRSDLHYVT